jgi:hypothetical protein
MRASFQARALHHPERVTGGGVRAMHAKSPHAGSSAPEVQMDPGLPSSLRRGKAPLKPDEAKRLEERCASPWSVPDTWVS